MISSERVSEIFLDCLFKEDELEDGKPKLESFPIVEGIQHKVGFNPTRLEQHKQEISEMLDQLPTEFHKDGGGGWSFLNACNTKDGEQWTGFHQVMDQLFSLGQGIGRVESQLPRSMWNILPGGVPYYVINPLTTTKEQE